jgi:hypothetical protein
MSPTIITEPIPYIINSNIDRYYENNFNDIDLINEINPVENNEKEYNIISLILKYYKISDKTLTIIILTLDVIIWSYNFTMIKYYYNLSIPELLVVLLVVLLVSWVSWVCFVLWY